MLLLVLVLQVQSIMGGQYSYRNSWHAFTSLVSAWPGQQPPPQTPLSNHLYSDCLAGAVFGTQIAAQGPLGLLRGYWVSGSLDLDVCKLASRRTAARLPW
jgi:hypothetical protein